MGGGIFDNVWDPYSGAYAYPRTQSRAQYSRPRASVYDPRGSSRVAESSFPSKVKEPVSKKTVRTIPVTDGSAPVQQVSQAEVAPVVPTSNSEEVADVKPVVVKLKSKDAATTKIQAVYRGYLVRKTQPLEHLRVIKKVIEELESFKRKLQETEQAKKLRSDSQERLRWTEGIMALLLWLDTLQGVHPQVRLVRKAVTKELIQFQETIDSMSTVSGRLNGSDDAMIRGNIDASSDVAKEGVMAIDDGSDVPAAEIVEDNSNVQAVKGSKNSTSNKNVSQVRLDIIVDSHGAYCNEEGFVLEPTSTEADSKVLLDVEEQILTMVPAMEEVEVEPAFLGNELPPTAAESDDHEAPEPISKDDASAPPAKKTNVEEMWDQAHHMGRRLEESERPVLDTSHNFVNGALGTSCYASTRLEEKAETASRFTDQVDESMIPPGCTQSTSSLEPLCIDNLQVGQPQLSPADDINGLSDRELLLQLLKENWKLKDVVENVLHWGKHQNDVIQNLAARVGQLEEHYPLHPNLLHEEENKGRKIRSKSLDLCTVGIRGRSLQRSGKGSRRGKLGNSSPRLGNHVDSEDWPSVESDEYF